jgi:phosphohistidine phosphatase
MLRLILVRHAKSAWDDPSLADIDRPLAERGIEASAWIGDTLAAQGWRADRLLCSPARRTRETLELAIGREATGLRPMEVVTSQEIYDRRDEDYIELIRGQAGPGSLMLVGHNPATEETATMLVGEGDPDTVARLMERFATGAIAVIDFDAPDWGSIRRGEGRLVDFRRPPKG